MSEAQMKLWREERDHLARLIMREEARDRRAHIAVENIPCMCGVCRFVEQPPYPLVRFPAESMTPAGYTPGYTLHPCVWICRACIEVAAECARLSLFQSGTAGPATSRTGPALPEGSG